MVTLLTLENWYFDDHTFIIPRFMVNSLQVELFCLYQPYLMAKAGECG